MQTDETYPIRDMMYDRNEIHSKPAFIPLPSQCGYFSQISFSDGQVAHPIFYSNPQFFTEMNYQYRENYVEKKEDIED